MVGVVVVVMVANCSAVETGGDMDERDKKKDRSPVVCY